MKSNYRRIGDLIQLVDERNRDLKISTLLGLSITKEFIPSVANIVGTDMANYKVIREGQFACSTMQVRRDKKMPVALLRDYEEAIISQAYPVFEVKYPEQLHPEYLMMWMSRSEFDRQACFLAVGGVRGSLEWDDFCDMQLPVPHIDEQREIVREYNIIVNRIKLNEQLSQQLEKAAQAIYKQWFIAFEFPDGKGQSYKSSGGEMNYVPEIDQEVPKGWIVKPFTKAVTLCGGGTPSTSIGTYWNGNIPFFTPKDVDISYYSVKTEKYISEKGLKNCSSKLYPQNTVFITARGTVGAVALAGCDMAMNQSCYAILGGNKISQFFAHQLTLETIKRLKNEANGAVFKALVTRDFDGQLIIEPSKDVLDLFESKAKFIYQALLNKVQQNIELSNLKTLLLSRMSKMTELA